MFHPKSLGITEGAIAVAGLNPILEHACLASVIMYIKLAVEMAKAEGYNVDANSGLGIPSGTQGRYSAVLSLYYDHI